MNVRGIFALLGAASIMLSCGQGASVAMSETPAVSWDTLDVVSSGTLLRLDSMESKFLSERPLDVWLPTTYDGKVQHKVLYMYDGQMLFDANSTWNHQEWKVDEVVDSLIDGAYIDPIIVVALHNGGQQRNFEYFPQKPHAALKKVFSDSLMAHVAKVYGSDSTFPVQSDAYLSYMIQEVQPLVNAHFNVDTSKAATAIAGSSMGGLMSMYALGEYPQVFGTALCMSTHWPGGYAPNEEVPAVFRNYITEHVKSDLGSRIYFDYGTETLDQMYEPFQLRVDEVLEQGGFVHGENWRTEKFPGDEHNEVSWASRLHVPLLFAFGTGK